MGQLLVVFDLGCLHPSARAPVASRGCGQQGLRVANLIGVQTVGNVQQHGAGFEWLKLGIQGDLHCATRTGDIVTAVERIGVKLVGEVAHIAL